MTTVAHSCKGVTAPASATSTTGAATHGHDKVRARVRAAAACVAADKLLQERQAVVRDVEGVKAGCPCAGDVLGELVQRPQAAVHLLATTLGQGYAIPAICVTTMLLPSKGHTQSISYNSHGLFTACIIRGLLVLASRERS